MKRLGFGIVAAGLVLANLARGPVGAQIPVAATTAAPSAGTVMASGTAEIKRQPESLRLQLEVLARGKTIRDALARLNKQREAARAKAIELGATKPNISFGEATVSADKTDRQMQMEVMLRQKLRSQGKKAPKAKEPVVVLSSQLRADFRIEAASAEDFLVAAHTLQEKIKTADLAGSKDATKLSPEEEELAEELGGVEAMGGDPNEPKRGEPVFLYVCKIAEQERAKALAEAFARAKREAARLAKSAGSDLDGLHSLVNQFAGPGADVEEDPYMMGMGRQARYFAMQQARLAQQASASGETRDAEAIGATPGKVTMRVSVTAYFRLKPAAEK